MVVVMVDLNISRGIIYPSEETEDKRFEKLRSILANGSAQNHPSSQKQLFHIVESFTDTMLLILTQWK